MRSSRSSRGATSWRPGGGISYARERGKPSVPVMIGGADAPASLDEHQVLRLDSAEDLDAARDAIAARARDALNPDETG
jgi:hypothetical protein